MWKFVCENSLAMWKFGTGTVKGIQFGVFGIKFWH